MSNDHNKLCRNSTSFSHPIWGQILPFDFDLQLVKLNFVSRLTALIPLQFECCGRSNGTDYSNPNIKWYNSRSITRSTGLEASMQVPPTCCAVKGGAKTVIKSMKRGETIELELTDHNCPFDPAVEKESVCDKLYN